MEKRVAMKVYPPRSGPEVAVICPQCKTVWNYGVDTVEEVIKNNSKIECITCGEKFSIGDSEPLPCPFCGKDPDVREAINRKGNWLVTCSNFGDGQTPPEKSGCAIMPATAWYYDKSLVVFLWNMRANTAHARSTGPCPNCCNICKHDDCSVMCEKCNLPSSKKEVNRL